MTEHGRDRCGGAAYCATCNERMLTAEGQALRYTVQEMLRWNRNHSKWPDDDATVIERTEWRWVRDKRWAQEWRDRARERHL
jgi:hypothetical protein